MRIPMAVFAPVLPLLFLCAGPAYAEKATIGGPTGPDGTEVACDMPAMEHIKNIGGRDGAGLCVFTSIEHSGRWQNCEDLRGFQKKMRTEAGGGYPEKVVRMMQKYVPSARYVQYSGSDPAILDLAIRTGRMPSVTYGYSERYGGRVAHMVNLVHLDDRVACILDNNFIGADKLEWMSRNEFLRRWKLGGGGWAIVVLNPSPPPVPVNATPANQVVYGQWGTSDCGPVGPARISRLSPTRISRLQHESGGAAPVLFDVPVTSVVGDGNEWRLLSGDENRVYLYRHGVQVGGWDKLEKRWMDYDAAGNHWKDGYPPWHVDSISGNKNGATGQAFFGVDRTKVPQTETLWINGHRVNGKSIQEALGADMLSDDSSKPRITLAGTKDICDRVLLDMKSHADMASMSGKFLVQAYRPGAWPTEVFRRPAGEEFFLSISGPPDKKSKCIEYHLQTAYEGPERLAQAMNSVLRRIDPNYDPNKTPDLVKPKPAPVIPGPVPDPDQGYDSPLLILVAILTALIFGGKRNATSK